MTRTLILAAFAGCMACSSGGSGAGGSGGSAADAASADATPDADVDADAAEAGTGAVFFEKTCHLNDNQLLLPGRTVTELAFAHPFVRIVAGDNATCCFQGLTPTFLAEGSVALDRCTPIGGVSIAGNRGVTWYVPKIASLETFEAPCSTTYYLGTQARPFAEHAFPGKNILELSAVRAIVHQSTPAFVYTTNKGNTEYFDQRPGQIFLRDGAVAVVCGGPEDTVRFVIPVSSASPTAVDVQCTGGVAEREYPGATLQQLASVRAIRHGLDTGSVGTSLGNGDVYQVDIAEHRVTLEDGSWTKKTPFVNVECKVASSAAAVTGPVTFVTW